MKFLNWLENPVSPKPAFRALIAALLAAGITIFLRTPLQLQLWNDELYSLLYFQRVPPLRTLTDYHETNNHVLFNFIQNGWIRILGSPPVRELLAAPWQLRLLPLCYAIVTALTLFFGLLRRYGPGIAAFGLCLLLCSIPYYNFALQARAYGMLIMLGTLQLFSFIGYLERGGWRRLWSGAIWAFMLFYAHPAGLYLIVGWVVAALLSFSSDLRRNDGYRQRAYYAIGAWMCGLVLAGIAYLPVMTAILHNPWVGTRKVSAGSFFHDTVLSVLRQLAGGQLGIYLLLGALVLGSGLLRAAPGERRLLAFCVGVVAGTYLMPLLRLDEAPQRTFTMLIPYLCAGAAIALAGARRSFPGIPALALLAPLLTVLLVGLFPRQLHQRNRNIELAIRSGQELGSIEAGYYLYRFNPLEAVLEAKRQAQAQHRNVYAAIAYRQELPHYLEAFGMPWLEYRSPAQRARLPDRAIIISSMLPEFHRRYDSSLHIRTLNPGGGFYEVLQVERKR